MPARWVICPVVTRGGKRLPKVGVINDSGRPPYDQENPENPGEWHHIVPKYARSNVISVRNWCVCFVRGVDMSALDDDPDVQSIFEQDHEDSDNFLAKTPNDLTWSNAKLLRIKERMEAKGADFTGLTKNDPLWKWLKRFGQVINPNWPGPHGTWVKKWF